MQATATVLAEAGLTVEGGSDGGLGQRLAGCGGGRGAADGGQHGDRGAVVCGHAHQRLVGGYPAVVRAGPSRQPQVHAAMHLVMMSVITITCVDTISTHIIFKQFAGTKTIDTILERLDT